MYGRARRLKFMKIVSIIVGLFLVITISISVFVKMFSKKDDNVDFKYLRDYLVEKGYSCELLKYDGAMCKYDGDIVYDSFARYDTGFEYLEKSDNYILVLHHVDGVDKFTFKTTANAFSGYKNREYECTVKDSLIGELKECKDVSDDSILDLDVYIGKIESAMNDLSIILKKSGYDINKLMNDYVWSKK